MIKLAVDAMGGDFAPEQIVKGVNPQGELVRICEMSKYEDDILKCKERICRAAQLKIMLQTKDTLLPSLALIC